MSSAVKQPKSTARSSSNMNGLSNRGFFGRSFRRNSMRLDNPIPITNMVALSTPPGPPISSSPDRESRLKYNCNEDIENFFFLNPCRLEEITMLCQINPLTKGLMEMMSVLCHNLVKQHPPPSLNLPLADLTRASLEISELF